MPCVTPITNIKNDVLYVDAGDFGELSFNKYDFTDTFTHHKKEEKAEQPKATFDFSTLKTFEKVLVRCSKNSVWTPAFFHSYRPEIKFFPFFVIAGNVPGGSGYEQCVPFIGNEHLMNTIDAAPPYYGF